MPPSPVEFFRQVLAMMPEQRDKALEKYSLKTREFVRVKLKEFDALKPEERENRLRTMELRWQLLPLMSMAPSNRVLRIQSVPERDRSLIEERLRLWDKLSPEQQRDVLECEPALAAYASTGRMSSSSTVSPLSTNQQERINTSTTYLIKLHPEKRAELYQNFQEFFELSEKEKAKAQQDDPARVWDMPGLMARGERVYAANCAVCHQATGKGVAGAFPALDASPKVTGAKLDQIHILLQGVTKDGKPTAMVSFAKQLSDTDIAAVITYTRNSWSNKTGELVQPAEIAAARTK
jgi:mono/diheme cytochrome c family protein